MSIIEHVDAIGLSLAKSHAIMMLVRQSEGARPEQLADATAAAADLVDRARAQVAELWEEYKGEVRA